MIAGAAFKAVYHSKAKPGITDCNLWPTLSTRSNWILLRIFTNFKINKQDMDLGIGITELVSKNTSHNSSTAVTSNLFSTKSSVPDT